MPLFIVLGPRAHRHARAQLDPALLMVEFARLAASPSGCDSLLCWLERRWGRGGPARRLFDSSTRSWAGCRPESPGHDGNVHALQPAFSGASGVTILALGGLLYPMLKREHYPEKLRSDSSPAGSMGCCCRPVWRCCCMAWWRRSASVTCSSRLAADPLAVCDGGRLCLPAWRARGTRHAFRCVNSPLRACRLGRSLAAVGVIGGLAAGVLTVAELAGFTALYALVLETLIHRHRRESAGVGGL